MPVSYSYLKSLPVAPMRLTFIASILPQTMVVSTIEQTMVHPQMIKASCIHFSMG
jgi:hypothetical protein